jgi:hypothetical protein
MAEYAVANTLCLELHGKHSDTHRQCVCLEVGFNVQHLPTSRARQAVPVEVWALWQATPRARLTATSRSPAAIAKAFHCSSASAEPRWFVAETDFFAWKCRLRTRLERKGSCYASSTSTWVGIESFQLCTVLRIKLRQAISAFISYGSFLSFLLSNRRFYVRA